MARWQPDAALRLMLASLELFVEKGYENTTVVEIAERAGVTKSTFFRHFPDKREVLFGGESFGRRIAERVAAAPASAGPLEAIMAGIEAVGAEAFTAERRALSRQRRAVIAANSELQEREALKGLRIAAALGDSLRARGVEAMAADLAAQLGSLTLAVAYDRWSEAKPAVAFGDVARQVMGELQEAAAALR